MGIEASIGHPYKIAIKPTLCNSAFVTGYQEDGPALKIKSECYPPCPAVCIEAQFLHVGMA